MKCLIKGTVVPALVLATVISGVMGFAEGSKELVDVSGRAADAAQNAYRPYLDWRDRDQFGMPSKNIVYVYANEGETVYLGSNVTEANDRSIEAVVNAESGFESTLNIGSAESIKGASIAVTLPTYDGSDEAFNPEGRGTGVFLDGSNLKPGADNTKVYLFKPDAVSRKGYIENTTMEANGPDIDGKNTLGYKPLSFKAPITGTYSFRFLSPKYGTSDIEIVMPTMVPENEETISIDFAGKNEGFTVSEDRYKTDVTYDEPGIGTVTLHNDSTRGNSVRESTGTINIGSYTYSAGHLYLHNGSASTVDAGNIEFTPLHSKAAIEIVWRATESTAGKRTVHIQQGDNRKSYSYQSLK